MTNGLGATDDGPCRGGATRASRRMSKAKPDYINSPGTGHRRAGKASSNAPVKALGISAGEVRIDVDVETASQDFPESFRSTQTSYRWNWSCRPYFQRSHW